MKSKILLLLSLTALSLSTGAAKKYYGYLYCHMSDRGQWTAYAISRDGYHYEEVLGGATSAATPTDGATSW